MKGPGVEPEGDKSPEKTSLSLLERVRRQDREAWQRLVSLYAPLVCHWCKRHGLRQADAEEVGQEVFLAVVRNILNFTHDREGDSFRGWLWAITRSKIFDHVAPPGGKGEGGSDAVARLSQLPATESEAGDSNGEREKNILYQRALELMESSFEPTTRRAFWLLVAGRTGKDVASELGISVGAVYVAKSRVLSRLRREFREVLEFDGQAPGDLARQSEEPA